MNDRRRVRSASAVSGAAAVMLIMGVIPALIHLAAWAGRNYRARRANRRTTQEN